MATFRALDSRTIGRSPFSTVSVSGYNTTRACAARELRYMRALQADKCGRIYKCVTPYIARRYGFVTINSNKLFLTVTVS